MDTTNDCSAYVDCAQQECDSVYTTCFGENYASGDYSGSICQDYMECVSGCGTADNCDTTCAQDCTLDADCQTCLVDTIGSCVLDSCSAELQECAGISVTTGGTGGTTGAGGGTCDDLEACCASLSGSDQTSCETILQAAMAGGDIACGAALTAYADQC